MGGEPVRGGPQGGVERAVGQGEGCCGALRSAAGRHSVATLSHRLAGPRTQPRRERTKKKKRKMAVIPAGPSRTQTRRAFPDTKAEDFKVCNVTVIFTLIKIVRMSALGSFPLARIII